MKNLVDIGSWSRAAAEAALKDCSMNVTEANEMLEREESSIQNQFNQSVNSMVEQGWAELVARQVL